VLLGEGDRPTPFALTSAFVAERSSGCGHRRDPDVAEAKARRDHRPKMKGVVGLIDRWRGASVRERSRAAAVSAFASLPQCMESNSGSNSNPT
jgi:hypothetical protein